MSVPKLRDPRNGHDLLDLLILRRGYTIHERGDLGAGVGRREERSEGVLWKDVSERRCIVHDIVVLVSRG